MLENIQSKYISEKIFSCLDEKAKLKIINYNKSLQNSINVSLINYKLFNTSFVVYENKDKGKEYNTLNCILKYEGEYFNKKRHGKGKEYYFSSNNELNFEGEYLNGKRNGKGKEYFRNGNIKFEGEYLNGKRWNGKGYNIKKELLYELNNGKGYVKEFNDFNNQLTFEGEYLNGEKNGKGKEYDYDGNLEYEGEFYNGERNGLGKEYANRD